MPIELVGIGVKLNGRSAWLDAPAAAAYKAAREDGCPRGITDAGRTNPEQWAMWLDFLAGRLSATAAYPGTSKHETGRALDLPPDPAAWMRKWGEPYGWHADRVPREWWHFEWEPTATTAPVPEEDDMPQTLMIAWQKDGRQYVGDGITRRWLPRQNDRLDLDYQAKLAGITVREVGLVDQIDWLGVDVATLGGTAATAPAPAAIDYAALARAINDDTARRMAD